MTKHKSTSDKCMKDVLDEARLLIAISEEKTKFLKKCVYFLEQNPSDSMPSPFIITIGLALRDATTKDEEVCGTLVRAFGSINPEYKPRSRV